MQASEKAGSGGHHGKLAGLNELISKARRASKACGDERPVKEVSSMKVADGLSHSNSSWSPDQLKSSSSKHHSSPSVPTTTPNEKPGGSLNNLLNFVMQKSDTRPPSSSFDPNKQSQGPSNTTQPSPKTSTVTSNQSRI